MNRISSFYTDNRMVPFQTGSSSYEKLFNDIKILLEKNNIQFSSIDLYKTSNFISVELPPDSKDEEIKNVKEILLFNGAGFDGRGNLFMGNVEIIVHKNQNPVPFF